MDKLILPSNLKKILTQLAKEKISAYAAGAGLRELAAGMEIARWSIVTDADENQLMGLFPECKTAEGEGQWLSIESFVPEPGQPCVPVFFYKLGGSIEDYLRARLITADAFALDGSRLVDPWGGLEDAAAELIRIADHVQENVLEKNPLMVLELIEYAAKTGFCLTAELKAQVTAVAGGLKRVERKALTQWFLRVLVSPHGGQGLRYIRDCGLLPAVVGERISRTMSKQEKKALDMYIKGIDGTLCVPERRLTVFYLGFLKKRDFAAMAALEYDCFFTEREAYAHKHLSDLHFVKKKKQLKRVLYECGLDNYEFLESIAKIQCKIYELDTSGILARHSLLMEISSNREPVFQQDLAISAAELVEAGAVRNLERGEAILALLPYYVHKWPKFNTKAILLDQGKKIEKNKWKELRLKHPFLRG